MTDRAYCHEQHKWVDIPDGWHQISVGTPTVKGDRYYNCKGEWVESRQPGTPVTVWTVYIRKGPPEPWRQRAAKPKAAQLKAQRTDFYRKAAESTVNELDAYVGELAEHARVVKMVNDATKPKAARLKGSQ